MDIAEIIKLYSENQKAIFTVFCIQIPMVYVLMFLHYSGFASYDLLTKLLFTFSISIVVTMFLYVFSIANRIFSYRPNEKRRPQTLCEITAPSIIAFSYIMIEYDKDYISAIKAVGCFVLSEFLCILPNYVSFIGLFIKLIRLDKNKRKSKNE